MTDRNLETRHTPTDIGGERGEVTPGSSHEHPTQKGASRWGHHLLMLVCCIPMLVVVGALVATGAAGSGAIAYAAICVAMMAGMMFFMPGHKH